MIEDLIDILLGILPMIFIWWLWLKWRGKKGGFTWKHIFTSREEVWCKLANEIDAEFVKGGFLRSDKVVAKVKEWTITLDTETTSSGGSEGGGATTSTRMKAPYVSKDGFQFTVYRKGVFSKLGERLGKRDIEVGYPEFDRDFVVRGNDEYKVRALFANSRIRQLIQSQPDIYFGAGTGRGDSAQAFPGTLHFDVSSDIKDVERLKSLFELFKETLNQLSDMGSAYESEPPSAVMSETIERKEQRREGLNEIGLVIVLILGWVILNALAWLYFPNLLPFTFGLGGMAAIFIYALLS
ncbi:MAG: DUF3137 domain-containing protein [Euryarchaeota archaeon]|nr:DUF3137 domain-containing protein [Euryarchaeota archaeon]